MEIEAKFRVDDDATFADLLQRAQIGDFQLAPRAEPEEQRNTYFDTSDHQLSRQGYGLRTRDLGDRRIATLKGGGSVENELHQRDEWEVDIGASDRPADWPASELRDRVLALLDGADPQALLTVRTTRRLVYALRDNRRIAELSLDQGVISAGGREQAFRELEIELLPTGTRQDFDALVRLLRQHFTLAPEERSKLARGMALLHQADA